MDASLNHRARPLSHTIPNNHIDHIVLALTSPYRPFGDFPFLSHSPDGDRSSLPMLRRPTYPILPGDPLQSCSARTFPGAEKLLIGTHMASENRGAQFQPTIPQLILKILFAYEAGRWGQVIS
jgi:hypothetical protein